jgi:hypothetical protein
MPGPPLFILFLSVVIRHHASRLRSHLDRNLVPPSMCVRTELRNVSLQLRKLQEGQL